MLSLFSSVLALTFTQQIQAARFFERPRPILTTANCEAYLLSRQGDKVAKAVQEWFSALPQTALQIDHLPMITVDPAYLKQPYEFFLEENQDRPFEEVFLEYNQRQLEAMSKQIDEFEKIRPLTESEAQSALASHSETYLAEKLSPLEKVALGLSNENHSLEFRLGDLKEVRIFGEKDRVVLITMDKADVPRGRVEIPLANVRLGFRNSVASWQAARYMEDPQGFHLIGQADRAVRRFFNDQGRVLLERPANGVRIGYLFEYNQTTSRPGRAAYVQIRIVTLRDCDRPSVARHEIIFPKPGMQTGQLSVCAALTEISLHTP